MSVSLKHNWTLEKLSALDLSRLKIVHERAIAQKVTDLVELCEQALALRKPAKARAANKGTRAESGDIVVEYHFVCREDRGVTFNSDGTFWSASWVVAEELLQKSISYGTRFALHNSKLEPSYRQGMIKDYRRIDDFADGEVGSRIDFLVVAEDQSLEWAGTGTGEKGYKRARSSSTPSTVSIEPSITQ